MAILYTLGFDCDQDEDVAREIAAAFKGFQVEFSELGQVNTVSGVEVFLSDIGQANNRRGAEVFLSDLGQGKFDCNVEVASTLGEWWTVCVDFPRLRWLFNVLGTACARNRNRKSTSRSSNHRTQKAEQASPDMSEGTPRGTSRRSMSLQQERNAIGTYQKIQTLIHNRVKQMSGYRSAMFGCEAHSDLSEDDWLKELDNILGGKRPHFAGLILKKSLTTGRQIETDVMDFSPGYVLYEPDPEG